MISSPPTNTINLLLQKGIPFAIYRLPDTHEDVLVCQKNKEVGEIDILDINEFSGFVVAPFKCARTGMGFLIKPDFILHGEEIPPAFFQFLEESEDVINHDPPIDNHVISRHAYLNNTEYLINLLQKEQLHKVVFSRVISNPLHSGYSAGAFYAQLTNDYPEAFVYLFHIPNQGTWAGATPESLLSLNDRQAATMSLAGTRPYHPDTTGVPWSEKDTKEQSYVSQFIGNLLSEIGISNYQVSPPTSKRAGHLEHRLTRFTIPIDELSDKTGKIIMGLHPTPAVCGLPKGDAYHLIMRAEQHDRRFYTGFLGPWNLQEKSHLFVNLRCAEMGSDGYNIYVGGGLTADSVAEREWDETVLKSQTLMSVMEKIQKFAP